MELELQVQLLHVFLVTTKAASRARFAGRLDEFRRLLRRLDQMQEVYVLAFPDAKPSREVPDEQSGQE